MRTYIYHLTLSSATTQEHHVIHLRGEKENHAKAICKAFTKSKLTFDYPGYSENLPITISLISVEIIEPTKANKTKVTDVAFDLTISGYPKPDNYSLIFSIAGWKRLRKSGFKCAQWTNEQLEGYNRKTGCIGTMNGIDCYIESVFANKMELKPIIKVIS